MENILCLIHTETDGSLGKPSLEALAGAKALADGLGAAWYVGLAGENVEAAANAIAGCGAAKFLGVSGEAFKQSRYATDAAAAEALGRASGATVIVAPATSRWSRCLAGVAQRLGGRVDTHVSSFSTDNGALSITRWYYRQRMVANLKRAQRPWILTIDPGSLAPLAAAPGKAVVENIPVNLTDACKRTEVTGVRAPSAGEETIRPDAKLLFVAGAGWTKRQADGQAHPDKAEALIKGFLAKTQASLGSSKSLVDQSGEGQAVLSFLTHLNQVGQTGATPRHPKGLSTCCHGEEPHVVGWRFINERRAINLDPNCGWSKGKTDVLYVADAFAVMEKVNGLLAK